MNDITIAEADAKVVLRCIALAAKSVGDIATFVSVVSPVELSIRKQMANANGQGKSA